MNILFAYPMQFDPLRGGIERVTNILAKELTARGHKIFFVYNYSRGYKVEYDFQVIENKFPMHKFRDNKNFEWYHNFIKENKIDIVINQNGHNDHSDLYCSVGDKCKIISVLHDNPDRKLSHLVNELTQVKHKRSLKDYLHILFHIKEYINRYLTRRSSLKENYKSLDKKSDKIVLLSEKFRDLYLKNYPSSKLTYIGNPLTYPLTEVNEKENLVLWVGRMTDQKLPLIMVRIWKIVSESFPQWKLIMIGDGELKAEVEQECVNIKNIEIVGFTDPCIYYKKAKILCMTSKHEGWGMVLTEAISQGCVPIAFNSFASLTDIINDPAQLVTPFYLKEYASKLSRMMSDKYLLERLRRQDYANIEKFTPGKIVDQWEALFNSILYYEK